MTGAVGPTGPSLSASSANQPDTLVERDDNGDFAAQSVTIGGNLVLQNIPDAGAGEILGPNGLLVAADDSLNVFLGTAGAVPNDPANVFENTGAGYQALMNVDGREDSAFGAYALMNDTTGSLNAAVGAEALKSVQTGSDNTGIGASSLRANQSGGNNAALGARALANVDADENTAVGANALAQVVSGTQNIAIGANAGLSYTGGESSNILLGSAGVQGESNVVRIGDAATSAFIPAISTSTPFFGSMVVINGSGQLSTSDQPALTWGGAWEEESAYDLWSLVWENGVAYVCQNSSGCTDEPASDPTNWQSLSTAGGGGMVWSGAYGSNGQMSYAQNEVVTASGTAYVCVNIAGCTSSPTTDMVNWSAIEPVTSTGDTANTLVARDANGSIAGNSLTLDGLLSLTAAPGSNAGIITGPYGMIAAVFNNGNSFFGTGSIPSFDVTNNGDNTGLGSGALASNTSYENTALGSGALNSAVTGPANVAVGYQTMGFNTAGSFNVAIGMTALRGNLDGGNNTIVGATAARNMPSGNFNVVIGSGAGSAYVGSESQNILIASAGVAGESNTLRIGDSATAAYLGGVANQTITGGGAVVISSDGQLGITSSSMRFKEDIRDMDDDSRVLMSLRPVSFRYKPEYDASGAQQYGLIAEEVEKVAPALVSYDKEGKPWTVQYNLVNAMLLNEFQRQQRDADAQRAQIATQESVIARQQADIAALHAELSERDHRVEELAARVSRLEARFGR
jgi:hypothetical protein